MPFTLPVDACPFERPFRVGFGECAAYEAAEFRGSPTDDARLLTCRHLTIGTAGVGRFYPKCELGDREDRRNFLRLRGLPGSDVRRR